jgi:hypothetical protein
VGFETFTNPNVLTVKVKIRLTPEQATKAQRESKGIALLFCDHGTRRG